jgi:hypothetical protein
MNYLNLLFYLFTNFFVFGTGGSPLAACCLRSGWWMGNVKDRYFKYANNGDQYVG